MAMFSRLTRPGKLDSIALGLSFACVVHCLAGIWLLAGLAVAGSALLNPAFHEIGLILASVIAAIALGAGALRHGARVPLAIGALGITIMAVSLSYHGVQGSLVTICGVALLSIGHVLNLRASQRIKAVH